MNQTFHSWAQGVRSLERALSKLRPAADAIGADPPDGEEWYELLAHKLLPQAEGDPVLVAAVVGGTNIGKSVIFNHLVAEQASGTSPMAAGTKHPVCIVPEGYRDEEQLSRLFEAFHLRRWQSPKDSLQESAEHKLFWRPGENVPERLLVLDTPDIDSDVEVNWQRADCIRQAADVLIAVLTQQKYNDAAVKRFFRKAVEADKPIVVVFNQCDLDGDRDYWPLWLATFADETGAQPEFVYVAPYDRRRADANELPFYDVGIDGRSWPDEASSLRDDLASLHFDAIKMRTLRGALGTVLDTQKGAGAYLSRIRAVSGQFEAAAKALSTAEMARVSWPSLPAAALVDEIRAWWNDRRSDWSRRVHGFYRTLGRGLTLPVSYAWNAVTGPKTDPMEQFMTRESDAIILAVEKLLDELERLAQVGNAILRPRLEILLKGQARAELIAAVRKAHSELPPLDDDYRAFLRDELDAWCEQNPNAVRIIRHLDQAAAVARPAITVTLAVSGWILAGGLVEEAAVQATAHTAGHLATEAAITGGVTGGGEALVSTTGEGLRHAAGQKFRLLQNQYAERRAGWLAGWLESELLGDLLTDLRRGAEVARSDAFKEVEAALRELAVPQREANEVSS